MFIAKQNNIIACIGDTEQEVINTMTSALASNYIIEETDIEYELYNGSYLTKDEVKVKERERLDNLSMTRGDVFEALILAKGLGKAQIRAMIEQAELDTVTKALYLNRFDEALEFYRGYPIFDMLGEALGISGEMLDKFFDTKDYHYLTTCKLTINATPAEATITGDGSYPYGAIAHYKVECEGHTTKEGDVEMVKDEVLEVVLEEMTQTDPKEEAQTIEKTETIIKDDPNDNT